MFPDSHIVGSSSKITPDEELKKQDVLLCYMHEQKFEKFLKNGLRLTRSDFFRKDDPFEAEFTEGIYKFAKSCKVVHYQGQEQNLKECFKDQCDQIRKECFISCWTQGPFENVALWRIYGKQGNSVAIKTNVGKLTVELENYLNNAAPETKLKLSLCQKRIIKIEYIDHHELNTDIQQLGRNPTEILHFKNFGYKFEEEVRIIFDTYQTPAAGQFGEYILIKLHLEDFIEKILVSPYACDCYYNSIRELMKPYRLVNKVKWSNLKYEVPPIKRTI